MTSWSVTPLLARPRDCRAPHCRPWLPPSATAQCYRPLLPTAAPRHPLSDPRLSLPPPAAALVSQDFVETEDDMNLGDMVISVPYVVRACARDEKEARVVGQTKWQEEAEQTRGVSGAMSLTFDVTERIPLLLVHGVCHLLGHDHIEDDDYEGMVAEEERLIGELKARGLLGGGGASGGH